MGKGYIKNIIFILFVALFLTGCNAFEVADRMLMDVVESDAGQYLVEMIEYSIADDEPDEDYVAPDYILEAESEDSLLAEDGDSDGESSKNPDKNSDTESDVKSGEKKSDELSDKLSDGKKNEKTSDNNKNGKGKKNSKENTSNLKEVLKDRLNDVSEKIDGSSKKTSPDGNDNNEKLNSSDSAKNADSDVQNTDNQKSDSDSSKKKITLEDLKYATTGVMRYSCSQLSKADRKVYREIYAILTNFGENIVISTLDTDSVDRIFQVVMNDHPELFYVQGYSIQNYTRDGSTVSIEFSGNYTKTADEAASFEPVIDKYVRRCVKGIDSSFDDYEKIKHVYEYIIEHTDYNLDAKDNQNILSVFAYGQSVCQGYAKATQYILNEIGIPCLLATGKVTGGESHAWNIVYCSGKWYGLDTTWGDATYNTNSPEIEIGINYDYLCVNDDILNESHSYKGILTMPECDNLDDYYYVREGTYFTEFTREDMDRLKRLFDEAYAKKETSLAMKCANHDVYELALHYLIDDNNIFDMMNITDGKVRYARIENSKIIVFYLQ